MVKPNGLATLDPRQGAAADPDKTTHIITVVA